MPRKLKRKTLAKGIYLDGARLQIRVMVNGETYTKPLPLDTPMAEAILERKRLMARGHTEHPKPQRYTLAADVPRYLKLQTHLHPGTYRSKVAMCAHWVDEVGHLPRHRITALDVQAARVKWIGEKVKPKTVNHRIYLLQHLYRTLDGRKAPTPCDDISELHVHKTPIQRVPDATILKVDAKLQQKERAATGVRRFDGAKTRARFRVLVSTGRRPSEVMRTEAADVDMAQRVWVPRDGKGGWSPGVYLNDDMLAAWRLFSEANAWGEYSTSSFAKVLRRAGWPDGIRPYNARHTTWITAAERGADMADVQEGAGHKHLSTTRIYTGVLNSAMQRLSERLEGRFSGFPSAPVLRPDGK